MVLKDYRQEVENPFGAGTTFQSSTFSGTYISRGGKGPVDVNINNDVNPINNVEVFD